MRSLIITQCLQNDFVKPIGRFEPLPNLLHVGHEEAKRLLGEDPAEGPIAKVMRWAQQQSADDLKIIHIRDWHDKSDPRQRSHLLQFGDHCLMNTPGAEFIFEIVPMRALAVIESLTLNDFLDTPLQELLSKNIQSKTKIGILGAWTEAKVTFLCYELATRFPYCEIAVCSALTASSSRSQHFLALEQLKRILGVRVFASVGEFSEFLGGDTAADLSVAPQFSSGVALSGIDSLSEDDKTTITYLFRHCRSVTARVLDGGFSGNVVLGTESTDALGHQEVSHVVKIGPQELIGKERTAFEMIESVMGNSAPRIVDFVDIAGRGALKYRYAAMGGGFSTSFQKRYMSGIALEEVQKTLDTVFLEQLGRLYAAADIERVDLFSYYAYSPEYAPRIAERVNTVMGARQGDRIEFSNGRSLKNVAGFYRDDLPRIPRNELNSYYFAFVHGDLNGANIIIDGRNNVWLIDFFHSHRGHVLKDLAKLENDLLYIFTPIANETELNEGFELTDLLLDIEDLAAPLEASRFSTPQIERAYCTVQILRSYYPALVRSDRDANQLLVAQLRYAVHTLSFDESSALQKRWALYTACRAAEEITLRVARSHKLRVDWISAAENRLGITLLPGRRDYGRVLEKDIAALQAAGVTHVASLLTLDELEQYGVSDLQQQLSAAGLISVCHHFADQRAPSFAEMERLCHWISQAISAGGYVVLHCVGGLGRSGLAAACYLKTLGSSTAQAIAAVREARSRRAIETSEQEVFVANFR